MIVLPVLVNVSSFSGFQRSSLLYWNDCSASPKAATRTRGAWRRRGKGLRRLQIDDLRAGRRRVRIVRYAVLVHPLVGRGKRTRGEQNTHRKEADTHGAKA